MMIKEKNKRQALIRLNRVYKDIPDTKGCMDHITREGGCGGWCCTLQNPSLLYVEFLNTWSNVMKNWDFDEIVDLIDLSIKNYLDTKLVKPCIFFNHETKMCKNHTHRPFNCQVYGITPEEEFSERKKKISLQVIGQGGSDDIVKDQCGLISTVDGYDISKVQMDAWWEKIRDIEIFLGIDKDLVNDEDGGTYRTFHDHIVLYILPDWALDELSKIKVMGTEIDKRMIRNLYMKNVKKTLKEVLGDNL